MTSSLAAAPDFLAGQPMKRLYPIGPDGASVVGWFQKSCTYFVFHRNWALAGNKINLLASNTISSRSADIRIKLLDRRPVHNLRAKFYFLKV
jgi:hypothetical protein